MSEPLPDACGPADDVWAGLEGQPRAAEALAAAGYGLLSAPLARRGVSTPSEADVFLTPHRRGLHDPFLLLGMEEAVERLRRACGDGATVAVVGDYDVDGVTACALLTAVLRSLGAKVVPILPNRLTEGYGFQVLQVDKAHRAGASLIVTVDCGTTSAGAVLAAVERGIDVIVTDHHVVGNDFPSQAIQINPLQDDCDYPFRHLCGAGLAFKLAQGVLRRSGRDGRAHAARAARRARRGPDGGGGGAHEHRGGGRGEHRPGGAVGELDGRLR